MAILGEFKVEVIVDGKTAHEYEDDEEAEPNTVNTVTKYLEAVSGKEYRFRITVRPQAPWGGADFIVAEPDIEGKRLSGLCLRRQPDGISSTVCEIDGEWSGGGSEATLYKYTIADLETRDMNKYDDVSKMKDKYGDLGKLKVSLWREVEISRNPNPDSSFDFDDLGAVPEKALKGRPLDVTTKFTAQTGLRRPGLSKTHKLDPLPIATFIFKYRTRRALQSLLIIERTPTPVPLEERDPDDLTREELRELVRRQRENAAVKEESGRGVKRERSNIVPNAPVRPLKSSKVGGKTVYHIDSSDDEDVPVREDQDSDGDESADQKDVEVVDLS